MKEGWEILPLKKVCKKTSNIKWAEHENDSFEYVDLSSVSRESLQVTQTSLVNSKNAPSRAKKIIYEGDVIFSTTRPTLKRVTIIPRGLDGQICSTGYSVIRCDITIIPQFVCYFIQTESFIKEMGRLERGANYPAVTDGDVKNTLIPIPPLPEQKQIVALLDEAFEAIDQAKANIERNIQNAQELFQSKLNQVFSQKGEGWEEKRLGEVCENLDRFRIPITKNKRKSGPIPYYGASGIVDYVDDFLFDEELLLVSEDGANLLARTYPIAFSISGKAWVNNHAHILRFSNLNYQRFIEYYLNSIKIDAYVSGMAQPKLNQKKLNSIIVPAPPPKEIDALIALFDKLATDIKGLEGYYHQKLSNLEELKKSLLQKAFTGELTAKAVEV